MLESNWDFPEICLRTFYEDGLVWNGSLAEDKVAGNVPPNVLDIKFGPIRVRMLQICPFSWSPRGGDGNPRVYIREKNPKS